MTQFRFIFQITTPDGSSFRTSLNRDTDNQMAAWCEIKLLYPEAQICLIRKYKQNA